MRNKNIKIVFKSRDKWFKNNFSSFKSEKFLQKEEKYNFEIAQEINKKFLKFNISSEVLDLEKFSNLSSKYN